MSTLGGNTMLRRLLLIAVPAAAIMAALLFWLWGGRYVTTENAYVKADIAQISAEIAGRVGEMHIRDHAEVKGGDVLVTIDPEPFRVALAKAEAELDATRSQVRTLVATWHEAKSELQEAESKVNYWNVQLERQKTLAGRGIVASSKFDKVERVAAQLAGNPGQPVDDHPMVREKLAERERAALDLARTIIRAPFDGTVVNVRLQKGDPVKAATPLFSLVADRRPWVEANFKETELTYVRKGLPATVVLDIHPDVVWQAEVESISPATGAEFALLPPQNATGNWVKVVQRLPVRLRLLPQPGEPVLRAGMTATVRIDTGRERHLSNLFGGWTASATATAQK